MPVTIGPLNPGGMFGPGITLNVSSSFVGPMPTGSTWVVNVFRSTTTELPSITFGFPFKAKTQLLTPYHDQGFTVSEPLQDGVPQGANANVQTQLVQPGNVVVDSGTQPIPWDGVTGLPGVIQQFSGGASGGLTDAQALQLQQTSQSTVPSVSLDALALINLTPTPSPGPVNTNLASWIWGVIVRIANVPPDLKPETPDGDYWFASLAVVRVFRGSDLWIRVPVHTSSKMISLTDTGVETFIAAFPLGQWIANVTLQVTFRAGVTGQVFLMRTP